MCPTGLHHAWPLSRNLVIYKYVFVCIAWVVWCLCALVFKFIYYLRNLLCFTVTSTERKACSYRQWLYCSTALKYYTNEYATNKEHNTPRYSKRRDQLPILMHSASSLTHEISYRAYPIPCSF